MTIFNLSNKIFIENTGERGATEPYMKIKPTVGQVSTGERRPRQSISVTCLKYDFSGSHLICSCNDEDVLLYDLNRSSEKRNDHVRKFSGHRNMQTIKGYILILAVPEIIFQV